MGLMRLPKFNCYEPGGPGGIGGVGTSGPASSAGVGDGGSRGGGGLPGWGWQGLGAIAGGLIGLPFGLTPVTALAGGYFGKKYAGDINDYLSREDLSRRDKERFSEKINDYFESGGERGREKDFKRFLKDEMKGPQGPSKHELFMQSVQQQAIGDLNRGGGFGNQVQPQQNIYGPPAAPYDFSVFGGGK